MRNDILAALERRETTLLRLLDKQVEGASSNTRKSVSCKRRK